MTKLINTDSSRLKGQKLSLKSVPFKIGIAGKLDNGFEIKDLEQSGIKDFHSFVKDTVYNKLTISQVEERFRRSDDKSMDDEAEGKHIIHFGKAGTSFRLFGYYDPSGLFVLTRIDSKHKTHKRK